MADEPLRSVPTGDDVDGVDGASADALDPADLAAVQSALAGLAFLRPEAGADTPSAPMPEQVWADLTTALAAERRSVPAADEHATPGSSRLLRWGGGLVAASVAVLAVGIGVTVTRGGGDSAVVVAGDAPVTAAAFADAAELTTGPSGAAGAAPAPEAKTSAADALAGPARLSFAGMVPPARMVVDSDMAYTRAGLADQVTDVLDAYGMDSMSTAMAAATPSSIVTEPLPPTGFTSSADLLRDCIDKLTQDSEATALLVDRSTFEGQDAGVVIAPEDGAAPADASTPEDVLVWVVDPDCDLKAAIRIQLAP